MAQFNYCESLQTDRSPLAVDFHETSFFKRRTPGSPTPQLPAPAVVRALRSGNDFGFVTFEHLDLFVKFGRPHKVRLAEAQTLQAIRNAFLNHEVPVPELYGWRVSEDINFIYMSIIPGSSLEASWPTLTELEKASIANQLANIIETLRTVEQHSTSRFIGSISRGPVQDIFFRSDDKAGPFSSVKDFNDRVQLWALYWLPMSQRPPDPWRALLSDSSNVCFSHGDLHLENIMIDGLPGSRKVSSLVDWGQSGWYPEYWEYCKMVLGTDYHDWYNHGWIGQVLKFYDSELEAFANYWSCRIP